MQSVVLETLAAVWDPIAVDVTLFVLGLAIVRFVVQMIVSTIRGVAD